MATRTAWGAVAALTWTTLRDAGDVLVAGARQPGGRRRLAAQRGAAAGSGQRTARELVLEVTNGPVRARLRRTIACVALVVLAWLAFRVAPETAGAIGRSASEALGWLAGVASSLIDWWGEQPLLTQIVIGAGIAALVVLSGGSLGLAMGVSGVLTWGLDKGHGIQTFVRDPGQATRDYVTTATPGTILADTLGFALTFAPTNFVGAGLGRGLRDAALDIADDPAAWAAARRASMRGDRGAVNPAAFLGAAPDEKLEAATKELRRQDRERMRRVWRGFPHGADDATKAAWYRRAATADGIPEHMRPILNGRAFNHEIYPQFNAHEVTIHRLDPVTGARLEAFRVDGLTDDRIISLKHTQLAEVQPRTAKEYIDEMVRKYNPRDRDLVFGRTQGNVDKLPGSLIGENLKGDMVLGVPPQRAPIPQAVLDYARRSRILIEEFTS
ncbi:hypothetical protein [Sanguibacter massiliensis]|uniref:hypothetical protein n=1 Tax=Sanguibacter massiliensis TaxID=1973217 RepID=UPI000C83E231|nr:hypothetical protein [Sanguibacter massiliensis]